MDESKKKNIKFVIAKPIMSISNALMKYCREANDSPIERYSILSRRYR